MSDNLRDRIATIVHDKDTVKCCDDECTISAPGPWDYEVADAVIETIEADYILCPKSHTLARLAEEREWQ